MADRTPSVYIITDQPKGTLYIGVTSDLPGRIWTHTQRSIPGFASRYGLDQLVWHEYHEDMESAILREKQLKKWNRAWKLRLVHEANPTWRDLYEDLA
ncbi:MAG: GIY-YIG nuclease family protein [Chloroflexota bacterium]|nr:GIY-YIG nuclease family protein [Chloroflexota bacterium]